MAPSAPFGQPTHVEIDALFHRPGWLPRPEFEVDVRRCADRDAWVPEWQYDSVRTHPLERPTFSCGSPSRHR